MIIQLLPTIRFLGRTTAGEENPGAVTAWMYLAIVLSSKNASFAFLDTRGDLEAAFGLDPQNRLQFRPEYDDYREAADLTISRFAAMRAPTA